MLKQHSLILVALLILTAACSSGDDASNGSDSGATGDAGNAVDSKSDGSCDSSQLPIVAIHGFMGSGDNYASHGLRFAANGMCPGYFNTFDWNSLAQGAGQNEGLDAFVDEILAKTGQSQVNLMGHSAGGGVSYNYLKDATRAAKVAHYVHIGSYLNDVAAGPDADVPTLNLWSEGDFVITKKGDIPGATNVKLETEDHMSVVSSDASFTAIYEFFNGTAPSTVEMTAEGPLTESGRAVSLGDNKVQTGSFTRYAFDPATGERLDEGTEVTIGDNGYWGTLPIERETSYEYALNTDGADRPIHYYRRPRAGNDFWNYLRAFPKEGIGALLTGFLNFDEQSGVVVIFSSNQGLIYGKDSLKVNGQELLTEASANKENTSIAFFLFDHEADQKTTAEVIPLPGSFPFLVMMDVYMDATSGEPTEIELNGEKVMLKTLKSESEGVSVLVF